MSVPVSTLEGGTESIPPLSIIYQTFWLACCPSIGYFRSNGVGLEGSGNVAHDEGVGLVKGLGVMFACWAEFSRHPPAGPQHLGTVMRSAIGTNAFGRFLAQADSLNAFNLLLGVAVSFFCFHCHSPC